MERLTTRCSTILIATDNRIRVFHSVEEIPDELREKLLETTQGVNSATILIADRRGREELAKAMRRSRAGRYSKLLSGLIDAPSGRRLSRFQWMRFLPLAGRVLLVGSLGYILWTLAALR